MGNNVSDFKYAVTIQLLGGVIEAKCKYLKCLEGIKSFFSSCIIESWITPDIIIYCDWEEAGRYLFRTSPVVDENMKFLPGVFYKEKGSNKLHAWDSADPPLPPFVKEPFVNSFVGLHAGAVKGKKNNAILFIGPRESGKTTSTLEIVNNYPEEYSLLTDETAFIRKRSCLIEPFPRLVLPRTLVDGKIHKYALEANEAYKKVATSSAIITHIFFLKKGIGKPYINEISPIEAYRKIINNYLYAGADLADSMITLAMIVNQVSLSSINYSSYEDLLSIINEVPSYLGEKEANVY
ncbi:hypothetical protein [Bacillus wiedmannii]|uniref:hypothetical protein n=2 Tax=Bacillus TaxID=1386 RepID=UPI003E495AFA